MTTITPPRRLAITPRIDLSRASRRETVFPASVSIANENHLPVLVVHGLGSARVGGEWEVAGKVANRFGSRPVGADTHIGTSQVVIDRYSFNALQAGRKYSVSLMSETASEGPVLLKNVELEADGSFRMNFSRSGEIRRICYLIVNLNEGVSANFVGRSDTIYLTPEL